MLPTLTILLLAVGFVALFSASDAAGVEYFKRQLIYLGIGTFLFILLALIPYRIIFAFSFIFYTIVLMLLVLVLLVGTGPTGRWLGVGAFHIQPSELAKLAVILALARFLSDSRNDIQRFRHLAAYAFLAALPFGLILIEPDLGTSLVIPIIAAAIAFWGGIPVLTVVLVLSLPVVMISSINPYALVIVIGGIVLYAYLVGVRISLALVWGIAAGFFGWLTPVLWNQLHDYQKQRLLTFINPEVDPLGAGYQLIQSKIAVGSGRFWGKGFMEGSQTQGGFLPEQHTDFIFSVIGEEWGFAGTIIVVGLFWLLVVRLLYLALKVESGFSSYVLLGVATTIGFQVFVNIGMTTGIMPVTGLPLPLISYGGSSLLTLMMMLGISTGMGARWKGRG